MGVLRAIITGIILAGSVLSDQLMTSVHDECWVEWLSVTKKREGSKGENAGAKSLVLVARVGC